MFKRKKLLIIFCCISLLVFGAVPVSANSYELNNMAMSLSFDSAYRYEPLRPDFLSIGSDKIVNVPIEYDSSDNGVMDFFKDYYTNTYLTVLVQGTHTDYFPLGVQNPTNVGKDKKWSLVFMKFPNKTIPYKMQFTYFDPWTYEDRSSHPIGVSLSATPFEHQICTFNYDYTNKKFTSSSLSTYSFSQPYHFSYVLDSSKLSKPVSWYPGYSCFGETVDFTVNPYIANGSLPHYNWWIGKKRVINGDNSNTVFPDDDTNDSSSSGGGSSGGSSSSGGTSSGGDGGQKPSVGGDGDVEQGDVDTSKLHKLTVKYFYYKNGVKTPFSYNGKYLDTFSVPHNGIYSYYPLSHNGFITEHKGYKWIVSSDKTVEVIWIPKSGGSGGGTSSGGGNTSSGGSDSLNPDNGNTSSNSGLKPFDPNTNNSGYRPNTDDPWGGSIFDGLFKPQPIAPTPGAGSVPTASDPFNSGKSPTVSNPFFAGSVPTASNPFGGNVPTVSNPFHAGSVPSVNNPFLPVSSEKRNKSFIDWLFEDTFLSKLI